MIYIYSMIFVTGGTGLIGAHLLYDLAQKSVRIKALKRASSRPEETKRIFSYYTPEPDLLFSKIEWVEGDLLDIGSLMDALDGVTHIYHCAAIVSMDPGHGKKLIQNNAEGTSNLVNAALEKKIQKFCHVSSIASLGIEVEKEITEETTWNDKTNFSAYAISKYLSENEVWRATQEGLPAVIVNPGVVIGPGNWRRSSGDIFLGANKGYRWFTGGGVGYVDVRDVSKAMIQLMDSNIMNEKFILIAENLAYREFMNLIYSSINKPLANKKAGRFILGLVWRLDKFRSKLEGRKHIFTKEVAKYAQMNLRYSNKKIRSAISIDFIPVSRSIVDTSAHFISDFGLNKK